MRQQEELRNRTKQFAYRVIRLYKTLPEKTLPQVLGKQALRAGTSVGANYRAVCRARSKAEFIARVGVVAEEADESVFWLEALADHNVVAKTKLINLIREAQELTAIFTAAQTTARGNRSN
jgi:four helix bundle protein